MNKRIEERLVLKKSVKKLLNKILLTIIVFLIGMITIKNNPEKKNNLKELLFEKNIHFTKTKNLYEKYFGNILSVEKINKNAVPVFHETLTYEKIEIYKNGIKMQVENEYLVPTINSGVIIFIGEKDDYGSAIIVEQIDGIETLYGNIKVKDKKLYDYIEKGEMIGEVSGKELYLVFEKEGEFINYKEVI